MTPAERLSKAKRKTKAAAGTAARNRLIWRCLVKERRVALGLTIREVSKAIGLSGASLCAVEFGNELTLTTAYKLCEFFGCAVQDLWPEPYKG